MSRANRIEPTFAPRNASPENPNTPLSNPDAWLVDLMGAGSDNIGPLMNERTAMAQSAVFACVKLISGLIAGTPLNVYKDDPDGGRIQVPTNTRGLSQLLGVVPFPGRPMTSFMWRELMGIHTLLWGNSFSIIRYDNSGRVIGFEALQPWAVDVLASGYDRVYRCRLEDGTVETVLSEDMLHVPGIGFDGIRGLSRIQAFARNSVGLSKTLEAQTQLVHENAARPSGIVSPPIGLDKEEKRRMVATWEARYTGRQNAGKLLWADGDTKFQPLQISPEDLNTLASRHFQASDVCRFFGVPPVLIGEAGDTTAWGTGIAQLTLGFLKFGLEADFQRIEHEINTKLLLNSPLYAQFDRAALLKMDPLVNAQVSQTEINSGLLTPNEGRKQRNRPSLGPVGDNALVNSTMIPLKRAVNPPKPPAPVIHAPIPAPAPTPAEPAEDDDK